MLTLAPVEFPPPCFRSIVSALALVVSSLVAEPVTPVRAAGPGQWSAFPLYDLGGIAIHMALIPGDDDPYHSRIVWWAGKTSGGVLGWRPLTEDCSAYPGTCLAPLGWTTPADDIFCGGQVQLATGELLTLGGSDVFQWGRRDAETYLPGPGGGFGSWSARGPMNQHRWYPTGSTLRDGRVLVNSGHKYQHLWLYGGRRDGAAAPPPAGTASGYLVGRMGRIESGRWDSSEPTFGAGGQLPTPRLGHTLSFLWDAADTSFGRVQALFGGTGNSGSPIDDGDVLWYLRREEGTTTVPELDSEYRYRWLQKGTTGTRPPPRSEHVAVAISSTEMVVFGGQTAGGSQNDLHHLRRDPLTAQWRWDAVIVAGGSSPPSPRHAHAAAYDPATRRMYVFGGADGTGVPGDNSLHYFTFDHSPGTRASGTWFTLNAAAPPAPRKDHTLVWAPDFASLLVFGGTLATGSDAAVYRLQPNAGSSTWTQIVSPGPGVRMGHTAEYDAHTDRMLVFGGELPAGGISDQRLWAFSLVNNTWEMWAEAGFHLSQHAGSADPMGIGQPSTGGPVYARVPEVFHPGNGSWTGHPGASWQAGWYPLQFVVPGGPSGALGGGRVVVVGRPTRSLDVPVHGQPAGSWQTLAPGGDVGFGAVTGVSYSPGKIMVAGGSGVNPQGHFGLIGRTRTLDVAAGTGWQESGWMERRDFHNLVLLPDGKVLVEGGMTAVGGSDANPDSAVQCPQIWDPQSGMWTTPGALACDVEPDGVTAVVRNYHSTALLLPDGRVLTAGGWPNNDGPSGNPHRKKARVYCPPYLFKADGSTPIEATDRPTITTWPVWSTTPIRYGEPFLVGTAPGDQIASVCLIRPAAVTHEFDQNQRYVPLAFEVLPGNTELRVLAPTGGGSAPPGNYLLFLVNQGGVPAVAKWVRLGECPTVPCDTESPPRIAEFYPDIVGPNEIWFVWTAPGDDPPPGGDPTPGTGKYDLRFSTMPITSENAYAAATQVPVPPNGAPDDAEEPDATPAGTPISYVKYDLAPCTQYHFALKTRDAAPPALLRNWSPRSDALTVTTTCGGGGGGYSAREVDLAAEAGHPGAASKAVLSPRDDEAGSALGGSHHSAPPLAPLASSFGTDTGLLEIETRRVQGERWQVILRQVPLPDAPLAGSDDAIVSQSRNPVAGWRTLARSRPTPGQSPLGLCALREGGRVVFPPGYRLDRVLPDLHIGGESLTMNAASHNRLGPMGEAFVNAGGEVDLAPGDEVVLTYDRTPSPPPGSAGWFVLVREDEAVPAGTPMAGRRVGMAVPARLALHSLSPNPLRDQALLGFDLPATGHVTLEIFDLLGRRVATLVCGERRAGSHTVAWDLRTEGGAVVSPGVYLCRMAAGGFRTQRKLSVLP